MNDDMFCVVYEFEVTPNSENEFKKIWHDLTLIIKETRGGLGSRLHKDKSKRNIWIAYAQWPNETAWKKPAPHIEDRHVILGNRMKEICINIRIIYQLDVIDDLLVS